MNAMKKIYSIIFAAATLFAASSCQEEIVEPDLGTQENESMTITAGFGAETKTVLDGLKTYWTEGDQISVFDSNKKVSDTDEGNNRCFPIDETATDFEDGKAVSATFKYEGEFVWPQNDQPDPLIVALYPYQEDAYCDFFYYDRNYITGLVIPTDQVAKEGGFDANATFALATSKYSEKENLTFTNLYTLLKITLKEEDVEVVKVEVTGGNIAGEAKVQLNLDTTGETPIFNGGTLSATENGTNTVTLTCEDGFEAGKDYYIAIAPVTYSNIKVYLDEVLVKDTTPEGGKILEPNTVYNISNLDDPHTVADGVYLNDEGVYEISKEAGLFWLAEQVKEGNTFDGKTVKLVADIEMTKDWTPIGNNTDGVEMSFRGNFDGKKSDTENYTISNLKVTASEGAGFFGFKWDGDVANVNFDKAVISGNHYAGVIVGWADGANYNYKFSISNCKVTNSKVTLAAELVGEEYDNGDKAGGIVGYAYAINVTGNTVSNTTITGYRDLGGIAGCAINNTGDNEYAVVSDNTVGQDVRIVIDNSQNYKSYTSVAQHNVASYVGRIEDKEGGHANEIEDNTGEATFETPKYPVERNLKFSETSVTVTYGATFTAPDLTGEVSGVNYSSSNTDVATVNSETGEVEIVSPGETTITASAPATEDFLAGSATYTLTVNKAARTLTFSSATATATVGKSFTPPTLTGTPDISGVKYTSSNTDVATVDESTGAVQIIGAGETTITATVDETDIYLEASTNYTLTVKRTLYLKPNSNWSEANARFAAYFFGNGDKWVDMTKSDTEGIYEVDLPSGGYTTVIFCRMNPATTDNKWENKWNQTCNMIIGENSYCIIPDGCWGGNFAVWSQNTSFPFSIKDGEYYLVPNDDWKKDEARFAAYFCNGSSPAKWIDMEQVDGAPGYFKVSKPAAENHMNIIFVRMKKGTNNDWANQYNQTSDLGLDAGNVYEITGWDNSGTWYTFK